MSGIVKWLGIIGITTLSCGALIGCSSPTANEPDSSSDEVRSATSGFFTRAPLSRTELEGLRGLLEVADGRRWVRNQGDVKGVQWEAATHALTDEEDRIPLAQAAFAFLIGKSDPSFLKNIRALDPKNTADLSAGLDAIGLDFSTPGGDTADYRAKLEASLSTVANTRSVTVLTATLEYQVDMYWEGALIVIDEEHHQLLVATGGYGT